MQGLFAKVDCVRWCSPGPELGACIGSCLGPRRWSSSVSSSSLALAHLGLGPVVSPVITNLLRDALADALRHLLTINWWLAVSWYPGPSHLGHVAALLLGDGPALLAHRVHVLGLPHRALLSPAPRGRHRGRGRDTRYQWQCGHEQLLYSVTPLHYVFQE